VPNFIVNFRRRYYQNNFGVFFMGHSVDVFSFIHCLVLCTVVIR